MSQIPTKTELATSLAASAADARLRRIESDIRTYTQCIIDAMGRGDKSYRDMTGNVLPEVQSRLKADFGAQGWSIEVQNARTGCTIFWS